MSWLSAVRERLRSLVSGARLDAETDEEMRFHLEMEAAHRARSANLPEAEARRQAALAFGGIDRHREEVRDARGLAWLSGMSLDLKLGARMLVKYPGLTLSGVLAIAVAVALASSFYEFSGDVLNPTIPVPEGDRIVTVTNVDVISGESERRSLHEFEQWRTELRTITDLSVAAQAELSVTTSEGRFAFARGARVAGPGLRVARVEPLLGRLHVDADQEPGTPLAVVLGYDLWQELYGGAPDVIGRTLRVGDEPGTVVGVMPQGYAFPVNQQVWIPLRERASSYARRAGPAIMVYGRLAPGETRKSAQAELTTVGARAAEAYPTTHENLRPRVRRAGDMMGLGILVSLANIPFILFLVVVCANVATLVFARTAARSSEIAVRSALGASRRRLVVQLIAESLVLTAAGTALGLAVTHWGLQLGMQLFWEVQQEPAPFWYDPGVHADTLAYGALLALLAATIIGGIPALKATGRRLSSQLGGGRTGSSAMRFGPVSTAVIVVQVALCVAFLPIAVDAARQLLPDQKLSTPFPADEFLSARIILPPGDGRAALPQPAGALVAQLKQRLAEVEGVSAVAFANCLPGFNHAREPLELEGDTVLKEVLVAGGDADFLQLLGGRIIEGRGFRPEDFTSATGAIVVDELWAREWLRGRNPIGVRVRLTGRDAGAGTQWREIVGVVHDMERGVGPGSYVAFYEPLTPVAGDAVQLFARTTRAPAALTAEVNTAVTGVDPRLKLTDVRPLDDVWRPVLKSNLFFIAAINVVGAVILMFALIGIYSLLSFTVAQRTREIAIRAALGAEPGRILVSIFTRAILQIGLGVIIGAAIAVGAMVRTVEAATDVAAVASLMMLMGLAGCLVPAVRALRIQPTDALRAE